MKTILSYQIYETKAQLPENWNDLGSKNIFLSKEYFEILEKSAPNNMTCHYIGIFKNQNLVGIAISQFLDLNKLESFGDRDRCVKASVRKFILKNFASHVLLIGNNMLTGQNSYVFSEAISPIEGIKTLKKATIDLKSKFKSMGKKVHITTFKDYSQKDIENFAVDSFKKNYKYCIQPNMVFKMKDEWKSEQDYINALTKKYRDQYKRARKKSEGIEKRKLNLEEIIQYEETIYDLYHHVAQSAPFNTFFLTKNHFRIFKETLKDKFLFYGYFLNGKLVGFNTLIKNGNTIDTYFLGYDDTIQRDKMLYLNMLYDMIAYSINKGFKEIIFSRTALEIKSSVGAQPMEMFGFMEHSNSQINKHVPKIFPLLEPEIEWKERSPFKE
ncbi:GNAT family N-acetyltransferase [Flavobacterium taihuense]|uniref:GNAT family N-acetyltransferase n=1 Tax=Flavobacterium taihuense TaxID=2857508 RepID=A0ABS6XSX2_9FLAO|nr:GNAT family N-acetyltransferase [Flavobacterium taihuense]MBW4359777.1 GNAT family N-acetyltransferase [Flavobacterium taihuense]